MTKPVTPRFASPVSDISPAVYLDGLIPGATVEVLNQNGVVVAKGTATSAAAWIPVTSPANLPASTLRARQTSSGETSDKTPPKDQLTVWPFPSTLPALQLWTVPWQCGQCLYMDGAFPGAIVELRSTSMGITTLRAAPAVAYDTSPRLPLKGALVLGEQLSAQQHAGKVVGPATAFPAVVPLPKGPLPPLAFPEQPMACTRWIAVGGALDGATVQLPCSVRAAQRKPRIDSARSRAYREEEAGSMTTNAGKQATCFIMRFAACGALVLAGCGTSPAVSGDAGSTGDGAPPTCPAITKSTVFEDPSFATSHFEIDPVDGHVYFLADYATTMPRVRLQRAPLAGGALEPVPYPMAKPGEVYDFAVTKGSVFFDYYDQNSGVRDMVEWPKGSGTSAFAQNTPAAVASSFGTSARDDLLYANSASQPGQTPDVFIRTPAGMTATVPMTWEFVQGVAGDTTNVFAARGSFANLGATLTVEIARAPLTGGAPTTIHGPIVGDSINGITLDGDYVYFALRHGLSRVKKDGGPEEVLVKGRMGFVNDPTVAGDRVYWIESGTPPGTPSQLLATGKAGGPVDVVEPALEGFVRLRSDGCSLYYSHGASGFQGVVLVRRPL